MPHDPTSSPAAPEPCRPAAPVGRPWLLVALLTLTLLGPAPSASARPDVVGEASAPTSRDGWKATLHAPPTPDGIASASGTARSGARLPAFASRVPARTRQVVRTVSSRRWCAQRWCSVTQAWRKRPDGTWTMVRAFRSTIGPNGFGKTREGDMRSPSGVYRIKVTFTTGPSAPGPMPWRRRLPTSNVTNYHNRLYNTWIEERGRTDGNRPSMRSGFVVDYNHPRLRVGVGPKPVIGKGSGIFYHTSRPGQRWIPTQGCTQVGNPRSMRWIVRWLRPAARPRVVQAL